MTWKLWWIRTGLGAMLGAAWAVLVGLLTFGWSWPAAAVWAGLAAIPASVALVGLLAAAVAFTGRWLAKRAPRTNANATRLDRSAV